MVGGESTAEPPGGRMSLPDTAVPWPLVGRELELAAFDAVWAVLLRQLMDAGIVRLALGEALFELGAPVGAEAVLAAADAGARDDQEKLAVAVVRVARRWRWCG
jgi:hypothetical protein